MALELPVLQANAAREPSDPNLQFRIRAEFEEMPGLKLTLPQALRLFNHDAVACRRALSQLVAVGVLGLEEGSFVLRRRRTRSRHRRPSAPGTAPDGPRARLR